MIYLDNAATTRPDLSAVKAAAQFNESLYYNPSALYREGLSVRKELNAAPGIYLSFALFQTRPRVYFLRLGG